MRSSTALPIDAPVRGLLVTSDPELSELFQSAIRPFGVRTEVCEDAESVEREWLRAAIRFGVVDLAGPTSDRLRLVQTLSRTDTPVLTVTSDSSDMDRILSLELGAQDSVSRPVAPREIVARILLMARRSKPLSSPADRDGAYEMSGVSFDPGRRLLRGRHRSVTLSDRLNGILELLVTYEGEILSRREICELLGLTHIDEGGIRTHMCRLRSILADIGAEPDPIQTVSGRGYVLRASAASAPIAAPLPRSVPEWPVARLAASS